MDATDSQSPPAPAGPIEDSFKVYNPQLYRELLGASDWSQTIEKTRKAKREALLAQHHDEEQEAIARRAEQERKSKEEREAAAAERRRQKLSEREESDLHDFKERTRRFFDRHEALMDQLSEMESDNAAHEARVREKLYRQWEEEVFMPIQSQVNREIENRAAMAEAEKRQRLGVSSWPAVPTATHTDQYDTSNDGVRFTTDSPLTSMRLNGADASSQTRMMRAPDGPDGSFPLRFTNMSATALRKAQAQQQQQQQQQASLSASLMAQKEAMWRSFIEQDNRRRRGHEKSGLFLNDDTLSYNPAAQREATVIRYRVPKPGSDRAGISRDTAMDVFSSTSTAAANDGAYLISSVDQSRRTAQDVEAAYARLAVKYNMNERESRTGKLGSMAGGTHDNTTLRRVTADRTHGDVARRRRASVESASAAAVVAGTDPAMPPAVYQHDTVRVAYRVPGEGHRASTLHEATLRQLVPRTHVPYDFDANASARVGDVRSGAVRESSTSSSSRIARRAPAVTTRGHAPSQSTFAASASPPALGEAPLIAPESFREIVAAYAGASGRGRGPVTNRAAERRVQEVVGAMQDRWVETLSGTAPAHASDVRQQQQQQQQQRLAQSYLPVTGGFEEVPRTRAPGHLVAPPARAMPLPLPGGEAERRGQDAPGTAVWARDGVARDAYLPTTKWGSDRLPSTIYGHYVNSDGSALVPSDRKVAEGGMKTENSTVLFDHFDYPKGMQPQHFGKRMDVWL